MKRIVPVILILAIVGYFGFRSWEKAQEAKHNDLYYGTIEADEVMLAAQVPGRVLELAVDEGQKVQVGELLVRIDATTLAAQKGQAEAAAQAAGSQARVLTANLKGLETELARVTKLLATGSATDMQYDQLKTQKDSLLAQRGAVAAQVRQANAAAQVVQTQIDLTQVTAPLDGVVLRTHIDQGETVFPGSALMVLADLSRMNINVYIPEPMLGKVKLGQRVEVFHDGEPGKPLYGKVSHVNESAEFTPKNVQTKDERVRLIYKIKVIIDNPHGVLKIGMPVDVRFLEG
jgi:RND family efflux transporter MFP subunit